MSDVRNHHGIAISFIAVSSILGALNGTQLQEFLDWACVMRGECYGREDWVYFASLIPIQIQTMVLVGGWLIFFSLLSFFLFPLKLLQAISLLQTVTMPQVKRTAITTGLLGLILTLVMSSLGFYVAVAW
ncbi:MAG TPA: hypothetical protein DCZ03_07125 [Gammaproteobacteria bacterium]|nr:hypothetical protein [Gammaproteobacteria bacterium]